MTNTSTKEDWESKWKECVIAQRQQIEEDCWSVRWKPMERELLVGHDHMKRERQDDATEIGSAKNLEEAVRYVKYKLADFAQHPTAYEAAAFQNDCRMEITRIPGWRLIWLKQMFHNVIARYNTSWRRFSCAVLVVYLSFTGAFFLIPGDAIVDNNTQQRASAPQYFYFSAVTLTTLGYGDYRPNGGIAQTFAAVEALVGYVILAFLIYIVTHLSEIHPYGPDDWMEYYEQKLDGKRLFY